MKTLMQRRYLPFAFAVLLLLLTLKQFWSLYLFPGVPFGYDAGIYRYLFLKHAQGFPPFVIATMPPWAHTHPLGLFFFSTVLLRLGVPVDWLIGWIWNIFPVMTAAVLARVIAKREGAAVGALVLVAALVSTVQYEGFLMIYWKVFAALLWSTLAFSFFERKSRVWIVFAMFAIATHQQIGLVLILATLSSILTRERSKPLFRLCEWATAVLFGLAWYLPNAQNALIDVAPKLVSPVVGLVLLAIAAVFAVLKFLPRHRRTILLALAVLIGLGLLLLPLTGNAPTSIAKLLERVANADTVPGAFYTVPEYLEKSLPLLLLALMGLALSLRRERGTVWQFAVLWCGLAVVSMFFFYRRFLLPMDFFLLPFAAIALREAWNAKSLLARSAAIVAVIAQGWLAVSELQSIDPHVSRATLDQFAELQSVVKPGPQLVVLDNMAPWVVGFVPENVVSGPGIFDSFPMEDWQRFLYGNSKDRHEFIARYPRGTYFFATDVFRAFYPPEVQALIADPCLRPLSVNGLTQSVCGADAP